MCLALSPDWYWLEVSINYRRTAFIFALMHFTTFMSSWIGAGLNARKLNNLRGDDFIKLKKANRELIFAYVWLMLLPQAIFSLGTLTMAVWRGEMAPEGHHMDDFDEDDPFHGEHGP